jgi:hypothetical protein
MSSASSSSMAFRIPSTSSSDHLIPVIPDLGLVDFDDFTQWLCVIFHIGGPIWFVQFFDDHCFDKPRPPLSIYVRNIIYVVALPVCSATCRRYSFNNHRQPLFVNLSRNIFAVSSGKRCAKSSGRAINTLTDFLFKASRYFASNRQFLLGTQLY